MTVSVFNDHSVFKGNRVIVLINNYNYGRFLRQCLTSVFSQECSPDLVIFVDDGSTDNSVEIANEFIVNHPELKVVTKKNAGQLSAFNAAAGLIEDSDRVFFLDSDDIWPSDYISNVVNAWNRVVDMVFVERDLFRGRPAQKLESCVVSNQDSVFLSSSSAITTQTHCWIGSSTSAISLTGRLFNMIIPYRDESNWITRADDVVVFSSSILGASKLYLPSLAISYRVHGDNNFYGNPDSHKNPCRAAAIDRLFREMRDRACVPRKLGLLEAKREIHSLPDEVFNRFFIPSRRKLQYWRFYRLIVDGRRMLRKWLNGKF